MFLAIFREFCLKKFKKIKDFMTKLKKKTVFFPKELSRYRKEVFLTVLGSYLKNVG